MRERFGIVAEGEDILALVADDDRCAGVLAARQLAARRQGRVPQELKGDEAVVLGRFGIIEDLAQLRQMPSAQKMSHIVEGNAGEHSQGVGLDLEYLAAVECERRDPVGRELAIGRVVGAQLEERLVVETLPCLSQDTVKSVPERLL